MPDDRRDIAPLLLEHFPFMAASGPDSGPATSDDWQAFLNKITGLNIVNETNATAFDQWRKALVAQRDLPVWGYSKDRISELTARGNLMLAKEAEWKAAHPPLPVFDPTRGAP